MCGICKDGEEWEQWESRCAGFKWSASESKKIINWSEFMNERKSEGLQAYVKNQTPQTGDCAIFYDPVTKIISTPEDDIDICPKGVGWHILECMKKYSSKVAQIDAITGEEDLYSSLLQRCIRTAIELKNRGIKPGDIISSCSHNQLDSVVPFIAAFFIGAIVAPLDPKLLVNDARHLLNLVKPKIMFASSASLDLLEQSLDKESNIDMSIIVFGGSDKYESFDTFTELKDDEDTFNVYIPATLQECAQILFSSGTTGYPKAICLSHGFVIATTTPIIDCFLIYSTLYWFSTFTSVIGAIMNGGCRLLCSVVDTALAWNYLQKYEVNALLLSPTDALSIVRVKPAYAALTKLNLILVYGISISPDSLNILREAMPNTAVLVCYGQTEMGGLAYPSSPKMRGYPTAVGVPMKGKTYKIVNPETEEVMGLNQQGELRVKTKWCMNGYYNEDTSNEWDADGFLKTGDIAYFDDEFRLYLIDRIKEVFKCNYYNITPIKLEAVLDAHPAVIKSTVIGIPDEASMHKPMGIVIVEEGNKITPEELLTYFNERVGAPEQITAGIHFVKELPLTPTGKVKRLYLKQMVMKGLI